MGMREKLPFTKYFRGGEDLIIFCFIHRAWFITCLFIYLFTIKCTPNGFYMRISQLVIEKIIRIIYLNNLHGDSIIIYE